MEYQNNCLKRLVRDYSSSLFCFDYDHLDEDIIIEVEFFQGASENSIESKLQEIYQEDGLLYDIISEDKSYKMMATFKSKTEDIYGIALIVNDTNHGFIPDLDYFGVYHQFVREDRRMEGISKVIFDAITSILKYLKVPKVDFLMQDHVASKYKDSRYDIKSFIWEDLHFV